MVHVVLVETLELAVLVEKVREVDVEVTVVWADVAVTVDDVEGTAEPQAVVVVVVDGCRPSSRHHRRTRIATEKAAMESEMATADLHLQEVLRCRAELSHENHERSRP